RISNPPHSASMRPPRGALAPVYSVERLVVLLILSALTAVGELLVPRPRRDYGSTAPGRGATGTSRAGAPALSTTSAPKTAPRMTTATIDAKTRAPELTSVQRPSGRCVPPAR